MRKAIILFALTTVITITTKAERPQTQSATLPTDSIVSPADSTQILDEFVVTARKKLVESDGAKLTYNVEEDPQAQSSQVMEILRKVPGVSVDAEDNIRVNGQTSFKIFLNGREDPSLQSNVKDVLKAMPASSIKKIEVISDPGAKYEAEGIGGILNIVTVSRQSLEGFMVNTSIYVGANSIGAYAGARTKIKNVTADLSINYSNGSIFHRYANSKQTIENPKADKAGEAYRRTTDQRLRANNYQYTGLRLNTSWEPDTLNLFTLSGNLYFNPVHNPFRETTIGTDIFGNKLWSYSRRTLSQKNRNIGGSVMGSYQHTFGSEGAHNIVLSYIYSNSENNSDFLMDTYDVDNYPNIDYIYSRSLSDGFSDSHIAQIDYNLPIAKWIKFETGAKGSFNRSHNHSEGLYGMTMEELAPLSDTEMRANQFRDVIAAYASADLIFSKIKSRVGLRYEYTHMGMRYPDGSSTDFTSNLNDLVPNASMTYNFTDASNLRFAYQMRISRPSLGVMNPYINRMTEGQIRYGNPDLESEKMHNITLSYSNYEHPLTGEIKLRYMYESNSITDIIFMRDGLMNTTYANIGKEQQLELSTNLSWSPINNLNTSIYYSISRYWLNADSELLHRSKQFWQNSINANADYKFPCNIRLSAYGGFWSPWQDLQSKGQSGYYYGLGVSRAFLADDALNISIFANNILPKYRNNKYTQTSDDLIYESRFQYPQWSVGLGISYRFGGLKAQVKRTAANIESDSEAGGGSKGGN